MSISKLKLFLFSGLVLGLGIWIYNNYYKQIQEVCYLTPDDETQVDIGDGWQTVSEQIKLRAHDKIRTKSAEATVVFYDSIIINLGENTEIEVKELNKDKVKISQKSGKIWNTFLNLINIKNFEIETPKALATVRGTDFGVEIAENGQESISLVEGDLTVTAHNRKTKLAPFEEILIADKESKIQTIAPERKKEALIGLKDNFEVINDFSKQADSTNIKLLKVNPASIFKGGKEKKETLSAAINKRQKLINCLECQKKNHIGFFSQKGDFNQSEIKGICPACQ